MIGTLASRVTGLVRNSLLAQFFPTGVIDAFVTAFKVPNLFRELLAEGALTNSFIPVYKGLAPTEQRRLSGALLALLTVANGVLMLGVFLAAPLLARLLISDAGNVDVQLTTELIRIVFPFLPAISFSALAMGILNAEERFLARPGRRGAERGHGYAHGALPAGGHAGVGARVRWPSAAAGAGTGARPQRAAS